eukprot:scaffold244861_cov30-Tisochrysis_lutea.AAC.1
MTELGVGVRGGGSARWSSFRTLLMSVKRASNAACSSEESADSRSGVITPASAPMSSPNCAHRPMKRIVGMPWMASTRPHSGAVRSAPRPSSAILSSMSFRKSTSGRKSCGSTRPIILATRFTAACWRSTSVATCRCVKQPLAQCSTSWNGGWVRTASSSVMVRGLRSGLPLVLSPAGSGRLSGWLAERGLLDGREAIACRPKSSLHGPHRSL